MGVSSKGPLGIGWHDAKRRLKRVQGGAINNCGGGGDTEVYVSRMRSARLNVK